MYVSKMHGKGVFYEVATHLILFSNKSFTFYPMVKVPAIFKTRSYYKHIRQRMMHRLLKCGCYSDYFFMVTEFNRSK